MSAVWKIVLLGELRVEPTPAAKALGLAAQTRFRSSRAALLLARLALEAGARLPREVLIALLWPEAADADGRNSLSVALNSLRRQLEPAPLPADTLFLADRHSVGIRAEAVEVDALAFRLCCREARHAADPAQALASRQRADALYAGPLLPGFYEDWALSYREAHEEEFVENAGSLVRSLIQSGRTDEIPALLRRAAERAPDRRDVFEGLLPRTFSPVPAPAVPSAAPLPAPVPPSGEEAPAPGGLLPLPPNRFFGRVAEQERLLVWLRTERLVTLTGMGGIGKTRLALEAARQLASERPVWFVELAGSRDGAQMLEAVHDALGLPPTPTPESALARALTGKRALLVLDNLEQLLEEGGADAVRRLIARVPDLTCLATSRRRLEIEGELALPLAPLTTAPDESEGDLERASQWESVRLFLARAQAVVPDFALTERNAGAVAGLCRRLEGLPLAIELAASRVGVLTPAAMRAHWDAGGELPAGRRRAGVERHRTLAATLEWSYALLEEPGRRFLEDLSVFRGGWTLEAAAAVTDTPLDAALEALTDLVESSLVRSVSLSEGGTRFFLLESVRRFAEQKRTERGDDTAPQRHRRFFGDLAEETEPRLRGGPDQTLWLARLEAEEENLRAALDAAERSDPVQGLHLAGQLGRFWEMRCRFAEGLARLQRLLADPANAEREGDPAGMDRRARALSAAGNLASARGEDRESQRLYEAALALRRRLGEPAPLAVALHNLGRLCARHGRYDEARRHYRESLTLKEPIGDDWEIAATHLNLGALESDNGNLDAAQRHYEEALPRVRRRGARWLLASLLNNLGVLHWDRGDLAAARQYFEESLALREASGDRRGMAITLSNLGGIHFSQGEGALARQRLEASLRLYREIDAVTSSLEALETLAAVLVGDDPERAVCLWSGAEALRRQYDTPLPPSLIEAHRAQIEAARAAMGAAAFERAWSRGQALEDKTLLQTALDEP